jgi:hypothetical protein
MSDIMQPALTSSEWMIVRAGNGEIRRERDQLSLWRHCEGEPFATEVGISCVTRSVGGALRGNVHVLGEDLHALAALALYGQPFGFTWEMVHVLNRLMEAASDPSDWFGATLGEDRERVYQAAATAIANIVALLPPRMPQDYGASIKITTSERDVHAI